MSETLTIFGTQYTGVTGIKATDENNQIKTYIIPEGNISITNNGNNIDVTGYETASVTVGSLLPTQHIVHLEFSDSTDTDINVYYNDSLIETMITAYEPSVWAYSSKTVTLAQLDNVTWYDKTTTWETIWDNNAYFNSEPDDSYAYITSFASTHITANSTWRVTWGNEVRIHTAVYGKAYPDQYADSWIIDSLNDGTNGTYTMYDGNGYWLFIDFDDTTSHSKYVKLERAVTAQEVSNEYNI